MAIVEDASTPAVVRGSYGTGTTVTSASFTPPINSMLVVIVNIGWYSSGTAPTITVSDSVGGTYTQGVTVQNTANPWLQNAIFYQYLSSAPGAMTVTATSSSGTNKSMQLAVRVVTGASATVGASNTSTSAMQANIVTTTVGSLVYCVGGDGVNGTITANGNTTSIDAWDETLSVNRLAIGKASATTVTPGSTSFGWSTPTTLVFAGLEILPLVGTNANAVLADSSALANDAAAIGGGGVANAQAAMATASANDCFINITQPVVTSTIPYTPNKKVASYVIYARDSNLKRQGFIEDFQKASFKLRFNDVGTWEIIVDRRRQEAIWLSTPGWGIEAVVNLIDGTQVRLISGQMHTRKHNKGQGVNTLTVTGYSDDILLKRSLIHPSPTQSFPPYNTVEFDVRTGQASTVLQGFVNANRGPGAIAPRRIPNLTIGHDPYVGPTITASGRWNEMLPFLQTQATAGGIGFRVVQVGTSLEFQTFLPVDRSTTAILSEQFGNLLAWEYSTDSPEGNYVYSAGQGTGLSRIIWEANNAQSIIDWGRREILVDVTNANGDNEIIDNGRAALVDKAEKVGLSITPADNDSCAFGRDYFLGDKVTIWLDSPLNPITEIVREVDIDLTPNGPQYVKPIIGNPAANGIIALFTDWRRATMKRLNYLERR